MVFGFLLLIVGCNEDKKSTAFDPNQPVKFTEFMPDSLVLMFGCAGMPVSNALENEKCAL